MLRYLNAIFLAAAVTVGTIGIQATEAGATTTATREALLVGELGIVGGPYPGGFHPTAGRVYISFREPPLVLVKQVGPSGKFQIALGPGTYQVIGCGPGSGQPSQCSKAKTITLVAGEVDHIRLIWAYAP